MASTIRISIADDCGLLSEGLRRVVCASPEFVVVDRTAKPPPDILLVDSRMEHALVLCTPTLGAIGRPYAILLGACAEEDWAVRALKSGARGILSLGAGPEELAKAIRVVHEGQIWACYKAVARVVNEQAASPEVPAPLDLLSRLSIRERSVLERAASGASNREIAGHLGISGATVKVHLSRIFKKLEVRDRVQLAARFHENRPLTTADAEPLKSR